MYILRCLNPDGLYLGTTCNGPGRCTTTYYNASGVLQSGKGIDMNRCFPYHYHSRTDDRNFNGSEPLACKEARAIAEFLKKCKGTGKNICIDTHGWYGQIITSAGYGKIYSAFKAEFPSASYSSLSGGGGYLASWAAYDLGYDSCLLELPREVYSHNDFVACRCVDRFIGGITTLLKQY